jgi:hypothetical protein
VVRKKIPFCMTAKLHRAECLRRRLSRRRETADRGGLRVWLRSNKLEQYAEASEANYIDLDILAELSEGDLERLGLSLGNRRRLTVRQ